jgi:DNA helicase-2/ATP-dependent DNA helicase PcrA
MDSTVMEVNVHPDFPDEYKKLEEIKVKLDNALEGYNKAIEGYDRGYKDSKLYLADYRHEIDPKEIFQNELAMKQIERSGVLVVKMRDRIVKLLDAPYFARIDFQVEGETSVFYIGRFTFVDNDQSDILIFDWRAPISSMFYDCELGQAGYDAPIGRMPVL